MGDVERLRVELRLPNAPLVRDGLATVDEFFTKWLHLNPHGWLAYLRGIDFHKSVSIEWLMPGMRLIRYDKTDGHKTKPFAYFTRPGTSQQSLGTNFDSVVFRQYEVRHPTRALLSTASDISFGLDVERQVFDAVVRPGGGVQYIVPSAQMPMLVRTGER